MPEKIINKLLSLLEKEYQCYCQLYDLAVGKKDTIIENDVDRLTLLLQDDDDIIEKITQLEEERIKTSAELAVLYDVKAEDINFKQLVDNLPNSFHEKLNTIRKKLLEVIEELHNQNQLNRMLVDEAIKLNNFSINMLVKAVEPENQTYSRKGNQDKVMHMIDRRA